MKRNEKANYVEQWTSYIKPLYGLAWTPDNKQSKKIQELLDELKELVPKVADAKIKASESNEVQE